jgi:hypothetical protein
MSFRQKRASVYRHLLALRTKNARATSVFMLFKANNSEKKERSGMRSARPDRLEGSQARDD